MQKSLATAIILVILVGLAIVFLYFKGPRPQLPSSLLLQINDKSFQVEVVSTPRKRIKGLSGRKSLGQSDGMLFIFPKSKNQSFWMKGMQFSIDIVWINNNKIIGFEENIHPDMGSTYQLYHSNGPADMVLELSAGSINKNNLQVDDIIQTRARINNK